MTDRPWWVNDDPEIEEQMWYEACEDARFEELEIEEQLTIQHSS